VVFVVVGIGIGFDDVVGVVGVEMGDDFVAGSVEDIGEGSADRREGRAEVVGGGVVVNNVFGGEVDRMLVGRGSLGGEKEIDLGGDDPSKAKRRGELNVIGLFFGG